MCAATSTNPGIWTSYATASMKSRSTIAKRGVRCVSAPSRSEGQEKGMVSELLERFGVLFDIAAIGIVALGPDGRIAMANPALGAMFGYAPEELLGQPLELLVPEELRAIHTAHRDGFMDAPRMRPMGLGLDVLGRRKDAQAFPVEASLSYVQLDGQ